MPIQNWRPAIGIRSVRTTVAFRDGVLVHHQPGAMPLVVLRRLISHIKAIKRTRSRADLKRRVALGRS